MSNVQRSLIIFLFGAGITLVAAGMAPLIVHAQDATPEATLEAEATAEAAPTSVEAIYDPERAPVEAEITGDNSYCQVCHNKPWYSVTLLDGSILNLYVNPNTIAASVHGTSSSGGQLGCIDCHGENAFPHSGPSPEGERQYTIDSVAICAACHLDQVTELESGLHEAAILTGNMQAAVCTDCHGAHNVQPVVEEPELIAGVCGDCHTTTLAEWRSSAHVDIGPLGCATCHSPHSQRIRTGESSNELCLNCHKTMPDLWVHVEHASSRFPIDCTNCHMYTESPEGGVDVSLTSGDMSTGHSMRLDTRPCSTCHEELILTGEWNELRGEAAEVASAEVPESTPVVVAAADVESAEVAEIAETAEPVNYVPLLQGLILGIGFGITATVIFVARGNRARAAHDERTDDQHASDGE